MGLQQYNDRSTIMQLIGDVINAQDRFRNPYASTVQQGEQIARPIVPPTGAVPTGGANIYSIFRPEVMGKNEELVDTETGAIIGKGPTRKDTSQTDFQTIFGMSPDEMKYQLALKDQQFRAEQEAYRKETGSEMGIGQFDRPLTSRQKFYLELEKKPSWFKFEMMGRVDKMDNPNWDKLLSSLKRSDD
jgi:hypothetical protein